MAVPAILGCPLAAPSALAASPSPAPAPTVSAEQLASDIVRPSVVYVSVRWKGYVKITVRSYGIDTWSDPLTVYMACTGAVLPNQYILTAGHCVDPDMGKQALVDKVVGTLTDGLSTSMRNEILEASEYWDVEGKRTDSPIQRHVTVTPTAVVSGDGPGETLTANVVDFSPFQDGDVALLSVSSASPMPALTVARQQPATLTPIVTVGYPGAVAKAVDPKREPSFKNGQISSMQTIEGVAFTEVSAALSPGMSGGPAVDAQGQIVGVNSWKPRGEDADFSFITTTTAVQKLLAEHNVDTGLSEGDLAYRRGLSEYGQGHFRAAAKEFERVDALVAKHPMAEEYQRKSVAKFPEEKLPPAPKPTNWVGIALMGLGGLVALAVLVGLMLMMTRKRGSTSSKVGCPACGRVNSAKAAFCSQCGGQLRAPHVTITQQPVSPTMPPALPGGPGPAPAPYPGHPPYVPSAGPNPGMPQPPTAPGAPHGMPQQPMHQQPMHQQPMPPGGPYAMPPAQPPGTAAPAPVMPGQPPSMPSQPPTQPMPQVSPEQPGPQQPGPQQPGPAAPA